MSSFIGSGLMSGPLPPADSCEILKRRMSKKEIGKAKGLQVLHLLRWFTHTPRSSRAFLEEAARSRKSGSCADVQNAYRCNIIKFWSLQVILFTLR